MAIELLFLNFFITAVFAQCPPGLTPLFSNNNFNSPVTCNPHDQASCYSNSNRLGTVCQYASTYSNYICCYSTNTQCGSNSSPQLNTNGQLVSCSQNSQCSCGFSCNSGICCPSSTPTSCQNNPGGVGCLTGQVLVNGQCYNTVAIGASCQNNAQCTGGSSCIQSFCQCINGLENIQGTCQMRDPLNGKCPLGTTVYTNQCVTLASPGQSCQINNQCIDNSFCTNGFCTCSNNLNLVFGYCVPFPTGNCQNTQTLINNQCVLFSIVGETCIANSQCVGGATCISSTCQCSSGFTAMYGYCIRSSNGQCNNNQVQINGQCYNTVQTGGNCIFTQQCLNGGTCLNSICTNTGGNCNINCGSNQVCVNNQCFNYVSVGFQCSFTQQCLSNSQCLNNICQCPQGSQLLNGVCSGSNQNFCSAGQTVQLDNTGQPINCLVSSCPTNSFCQYSSAGQRYVCCRSTSGKKK